MLPKIFEQLNPEDALLLAAAGVWDVHERKQFIGDLLKASLDWERIVKLARQNGIAPVLFQELKRQDFVRVPDTPRDLLERSYRFTLQNNMTLLFELGHILREFNSRGIRIIPYKGPYCALKYYDDIGLRPCGDLDFLVSREDTMKAGDLLMELGYRHRDQRWNVHSDNMFRQTNEFTMDHSKILTLTVEIHWNLLSPAVSHDKETDRLWTLSTPSVFQGIPFHALTDEGEFLVLALHGGVKHHWTPIRIVSDLARMLRKKTELDWNIIMSGIQGNNTKQWVELGFRIARDVLGAPDGPQWVKKNNMTPWMRGWFGLTMGRYMRDDLRWPGFGEWRKILGENGKPSSKGMWNITSLNDLYAYLIGAFTPEYGDHHAQAGKQNIFSYGLRYAARPIRHLKSNGLGMLQRLK